VIDQPLTGRAALSLILGILIVKTLTTTGGAGGAVHGEGVGHLPQRPVSAASGR
jgi:hypothetical protein